MRKTKDALEILEHVTGTDAASPALIDRPTLSPKLRRGRPPRAPCRQRDVRVRDGSPPEQGFGDTYALLAERFLLASTTTTSGTRRRCLA